MNKMKKMIPLVLAIILVIGMFPVYTVSAKTAKPAKPKLTLKVTDVTEGYVRVLIKIGKTKNAEGYEIYEEDLAHGETEFRNIYTLEKSGTQEREYAIRYSHRDGKLAIKVRAYNGTKFGKFSKVKTIDFTKYKYKEPKPEKEAITKDGDMLYNSNQIKISYKGLKDNKVNFEIKNNRNGSVRYGVYGCAVNSCMIHSKVYGMNDILSGKKVNESYSIYDTEDYGIKTYETIDVALEFYDVDNGYKTLDTCVIHIRLKDSMEAFVPNIKGKEFLDNDIITASFVAESTDIKDMGVLYYNKTDRVVYASLFNVSIDDTMIPLTTGFMDVPILIPNCYGYSRVESKNVLWSSTMDYIEESKLTKPKKIDACVYVEARKNWEDLLQTKELHIYKK